MFEPPASSPGTETCASRRCSRCRRELHPPAVWRQRPRRSRPRRACEGIRDGRASSCVLVSSPSPPIFRFCPLRCSRGQRESIGFDVYKHPADPSYSPVKIRRFGLLQIGEEAPDPRREMLLEQLAIGTGWSVEAAARKPRHDLAQDRRVVLGLRLARRAFEPELAQMRAQARERTLVQEAGEIIRSVGQKFPAPETDEKIEIFAREALDIGALRRFCERDVRQSERARIAAQCPETLEQRG